MSTRTQRAAEKLLEIFPHRDCWNTTAYDAALAVLEAAGPDEAVKHAFDQGVAHGKAAQAAAEHRSVGFGQ